MNFNKAQLGAIEHKDGAMLVLAGPGSGKTAVITHRTKNLITKHHVKPSEILVITFTKAAANEMKEPFPTRRSSDLRIFWYFSCCLFYDTQICISLYKCQYCR